MSAGARPAPPPPPPARIVLTGFMGAGKSTVGRILAARLGWRFFDSDSQVAVRHRLSVAEIFAQHGEPRFRAWEAEAVRELLAESACVLALGGGALETSAVRELLFDYADAATFTVYLQAPLDELLARCATASGNPTRPLLAAPDEVTQARLTRRLPLYQRARLTLPTRGTAPEAVVEALLALIPGLDTLATVHRGHRVAISKHSEGAS
jgi:shikimate kinase